MKAEEEPSKAAFPDSSTKSTLRPVVRPKTFQKFAAAKEGAEGMGNDDSGVKYLAPLV